MSVLTGTSGIRAFLTFLGCGYNLGLLNVGLHLSMASAFIRPSLSFIGAEDWKASVIVGRKRNRPSSTRISMMEDTPLETHGLEFPSEEAYMEHLAGQAALPQGFSVGTEGFEFSPLEVPGRSTMNITAIALDELHTASILLLYCNYTATVLLL
ncbi:unnamed protein product [Discosporangium mesarthrocarpum]